MTDHLTSRPGDADLPVRPRRALADADTVADAPATTAPGTTPATTTRTATEPANATTGNTGARHAASSATGATGVSTPEPPEHLTHATPWKATALTVLGGVLLVSLVLLAFIWPSYTSKARNMPVGVVGPQQVASTVSDRLSQSGAFKPRTLASRDELVHQIEHRDVYGGVVLNQDGTSELLIASGASPVAAQALQGAAQGMVAGQMQQAIQARQKAATAAATSGAQAAAAAASAQTLAKVAMMHPDLQPQADQAAQAAKAAGAQAEKARAAASAGSMPSLKVTDIAPLSSHDTRGAGLSVLALPLAMGGMLGGAVIAMLVHGLTRRLASMAGYGIVGGLMLILVLHSWMHIVVGGFFKEWLAMAVALAGTAALIVGLRHLIGVPGMLLGAVITMFLGNPMSSMSAPVEFMPWHWGTIGQFLMPGAAGSLLRKLSYFPHASMAREWWVLIGWLVLGLALNVVAHAHHGPTSMASPNGAKADADEPAPAAA